MSPDKFSKRMTALGKTFDANRKDLLPRTALVVHAVVALGTPVDTGRARGSWLVAIGSRPAEGTAETPADYGFSASHAKAQSTLRGYKDQGEVHITNNLPYIVPLNEGHSQQAPAGFVEDAIAAGVKHIKGVRLLSPRRAATGE
jgi:hypothetical protein